MILSDGSLIGDNNLTIERPFDDLGRPTEGQYTEDSGGAGAWVGAQTLGFLRVVSGSFRCLCLSLALRELGG